MPFDISSTSTLEAASTGAPMKLINSATGDFLVDEAEVPVTITLRGRNSREAQAAQRENLDRNLELQRRGQQASAASIEANLIHLLVACTVDWTFTELAGAPFPCSPANAARFWADPRFKSFRDQAEAFIGAEANFTTR